MKVKRAEKEASNFGRKENRVKERGKISASSNMCVSFYLNDLNSGSISAVVFPKKIRKFSLYLITGLLSKQSLSNDEVFKLLCDS